MKLLLTGGNGRLGRELQRLLPEITAPSRSELDLSHSEQLEAALARYAPDALVHAAAYTDVARAERERERCWAVNVGGTRTLVRAALEHGLKVVHISTDYVFPGDRGRYREDEPPGPARNYYALSKLVAEELVRLLPRFLIVRTSFRPREWPYDNAFADVFTSQDYVDVIAPEIALALRNLDDIPFDTLHIATERKSVFELAQRRKPEVRRSSRSEAGVALPEDISLDISRWQDLKGQLRVSL